MQLGRNPFQYPQGYRMRAHHMARKSNAEIAAQQDAAFQVKLDANNAAMMAQFAQMLQGIAPAVPAVAESKATKGTKSAPAVASKAVPVNIPLSVDTIAHYNELTESSTRNGRTFSPRYATAPALVQSHLLGKDGKDAHLVRMSVIKSSGFGEGRKQVAQGDMTYTKQQLGDFIAALVKLEKSL